MWIASQSCTNLPGIFSRSLANQRLEIFDEVRLIETQKIRKYHAAAGSYHLCRKDRVTRLI